MPGTLNFGTPNGTAFSVACKPGAYINAFYGHAGEYVDTLGAQCSDGQDLGHVGAMSEADAKAARSAVKTGGPYTSFSIWGDYDNLISFNKIKGSVVGFEDAQQCSTGAATGLSGTYDGTHFNSLSVTCSAPSNYCYDHIESPVCAEADATTLNMACGAKWTGQCSARFAELSEALAAQYCYTNKSDPLCACYGEAPAYIPKQVDQMPQCWSAKCAKARLPAQVSHGVCPTVTLGSLDIPAGADLLTPNIQIVPGHTPTAPPPSDTNMLIFIIIICAAFGVGCLLVWYYYIDDSDDQSSDAERDDQDIQDAESPRKHKKKSKR